MILSGQEIIKEVKNKNIIIEPFEQKNINPNSYNYKLGNQYKIVSIDETLDYKNRSIDENNPLSYISEKGLLIEPGKIYLATTYEIIGSHKFVTLLIGRSSVGRLGLFLEISADLGNLGTNTSNQNVDPKVAFADQNQKLKDMGFINEDLNLEVLKQTGGNVDAAVEKLLNLLN